MLDHSSIKRMIMVIMIMMMTVATNTDVLNNGKFVSKPILNMICCFLTRMVTRLGLWVKLPSGMPRSPAVTGAKMLMGSWSNSCGGDQGQRGLLSKGLAWCLGYMWGGELSRAGGTFPSPSSSSVFWSINCGIPQISGILTRNFGDLLEGKCGLGGESEAAERHSHRRSSNFLSFPSRNFTNILKGNWESSPTSWYTWERERKSHRLTSVSFFFLI